MKQYNAKKILNIALAGHGGCGKTSVAESMIYLAKASERLGNIADGNTVLDYDSEEIKRQTSILTSVAPIEWKNTKINIIDTPGLFDFEGGVAEGMRAADSALIVVSGKDGVNVGTEKAVKAATKAGLTKIFFVNGLCDESARFYRVFESLKATFGPTVCPVVVPYIVDGQANTYVNLFDYKAYKYDTDGSVVQTPLPDMGDRLEGLREAIKEAVAETSEELLDKFIMGEEFTPEEIILGVSKGVKDGTICPVFCGDAHNTFAFDQLLNSLVWLAPTAADKGDEIAVDVDGEPVEISVNENAAAAAVVFKTVVDPFVGKLAYFRVYSGTVNSGSYVLNATKGKKERVGRILQMHANKRHELEKVYSGDIAAAIGFKFSTTGDTICDEQHPVILESMEFPEPVIDLAIEPKTKAGQEKMAIALAKLAEEDPTFKTWTNQETGQTIIAGMGELHLEIIVDRLLREFKVEANVGAPQVAYKETITGNADVDMKYKRQSGGSGQYGHVKIRVEPNESGKGYEFSNDVVGGSIPKEFIPAVDAGIQGALNAGVLAGYPVVDIKVSLYDGSYHEVDSSEMAFKIAGSMAFKDAMRKADPVLTEPIMKVVIITPDDYMGDVIGDVNSRRGQIQSMEPVSGAQQITAMIPLSEMFGYATDLRSKTQGRGQYSMEPDHFAEVPKSILEKVASSRAQHN